MCVLAQNPLTEFIFKDHIMHWRETLTKTLFKYPITRQKFAVERAIENKNIFQNQGRNQWSSSWKIPGAKLQEIYGVHWVQKHGMDPCRYQWIPVEKGTSLPST